MKNKLLALFYFSFFISINGNALDCIYTTVSENFIQSNTVFIAKILDQENEIIKGKEVQAWNIKVKKTFKGNPVKK